MNPSTPHRHPLLRWLRQGAYAVLALLLVFEEWGWEPLAWALAWLGRLPVLRRLEAAVAHLPPWGALAVFAVPGVALLPIKVLALYLFAHGHATTGLAVLVAAKVGGTAVVARLFQLTQPALMRLRWFARWYPRWLRWKESLLARLRASGPWRMARAWKTQVRRWWRVRVR